MPLSATPSWGRSPSKSSAHLFRRLPALKEKRMDREELLKMLDLSARVTPEGQELAVMSTRQATRGEPDRAGAGRMGPASGTQVLQESDRLPQTGLTRTPSPTCMEPPLARPATEGGLYRPHRRAACSAAERQTTTPCTNYDAQRGGLGHRRSCVRRAVRRQKEDPRLRRRTTSTARWHAAGCREGSQRASRDVEGARGRRRWAWGPARPAATTPR